MYWILHPIIRCRIRHIAGTRGIHVVIFHFSSSFYHQDQCTVASHLKILGPHNLDLVWSHNAKAGGLANDSLKDQAPFSGCRSLSASAVLTLPKGLHVWWLQCTQPALAYCWSTLKIHPVWIDIERVFLSYGTCGVYIEIKSKNNFLLVEHALLQCNTQIRLKKTEERPCIAVIFRHNRWSLAHCHWENPGDNRV